MFRTAVTSLLGTVLLAECGYFGAELTAAERDEAFWTAYEQRTGMAGKQLGNLVGVKATVIRYGHALCGQLEKGVDPQLIASRPGRYGAAEIRVHLETAAEFLCVEQAARLR